MKAKKATIFGAVMALVLAVALASVGVVQDTASADPDELEWTEITIPEEGAEGDYALWNGSDVVSIAVSPDGGTLFAALAGVEPIAIGTLTLTIDPAIAARGNGTTENNTCVTYVAARPGAAGDAITINYTNVTTPNLEVTVVGTNISVELADDGAGNITSNASAVVAAINGDTNASALVFANLSPGCVGNETLAVETAFNLTGGSDGDLVIFQRGLTGGNITGNLSASVTPGFLEGNLTVDITGTIETDTGNVTGNFSFTVTGPKPGAITGNFTGALNSGCGNVSGAGTFNVTVTGAISAAGTVSGNFSGNHTANITPCDMSLGASVSGDVMVARALMKSTDDGYTWTRTGFAAAIAAEGDGSYVVDIVVSPTWGDDDIVLVATQNKTYISDDRGVEFSDTGLTSTNITSLDAAIDEDGHLAMVAGDGVDVYLKTWVSGWVAQNVGAAYSVLDVAFSPSYASDGQIVAVVTGNTETLVRAKFFEEAWGATDTDATVLDKDSNSNSSVYASIGFPDDYDALAGPLFVGILSTAVGTAPNPMGDVWRIDWSSTASVATDLNVRDSGSFEDTMTDICSIAVSGNASAATILVGTEALNTSLTPNQYLVHWSTDSGESWLPSVTETDTKQPTGTAWATVIMASPIAYVGTVGPESAFSASTSDPVGLSWNQRGLIDTEIDTINDIAPSPAYATDGTLYMATQTGGIFTSSLWRTTDEGDTWERILTSTPLTNCEFDKVELCEGGIFVASNSTIYRSTDDDCDTCDVGTLFVKKITPREDIQDRAWAVVDTTTIYTGDEDGNVWKTTNAGLRWDKPDESDITGSVNSIVVGPDGAILVGNEAGNVYICLNVTVAFEFERVGPGAVDGNKVYVAFDVDYADNAMVYAGTEDKDIYRFVIDESTVWDEITPDEWTWSVQVRHLVAAEDGALYGLNISSPVRTVNPTEEDVDDINFELMDTELGLPTTTSLSLLEVVPGSNILFTANTTKLWIFEDTLTGKPTLASPSDGATSGDILEEQAEARVVLSWTEMEGAEWYQYEVALDEDLESVITNATGYVEGVVKDVELWLGTTYYWHARVAKANESGAPLLSQWSETWSFTTPLGPGAARPELESPEAGETAIGLMPVLEWSGLVDAVNYELMVARDCDWTDLAVDKTGDNALGAVTTYAVPSGVLAYDTDYCWKVKALSETTSSPWSDEGSFRTMTESAAAEGAPTAAWVWAVIAIGAILLIALIVFTVRTSRPV